RSAFEQLGCAGWAKAANAELGRISGRRAAPDDGLTPSERKVADLVASGLSNKEVAAQLFVSVYTVEAHLKKVYAKLGIRSRTPLAGRIWLLRVALPAGQRSQVSGISGSRSRSYVGCTFELWSRPTPRSAHADQHKEDSHEEVHRDLHCAGGA